MLFMNIFAHVRNYSVRCYNVVRVSFCRGRVLRGGTTRGPNRGPAAVEHELSGPHHHIWAQALCTCSLPSG